MQDGREAIVNTQAVRRNLLRYVWQGPSRSGGEADILVAGRKVELYILVPCCDSYQLYSML